MFSGRFHVVFASTPRTKTAPIVQNVYDLHRSEHPVVVKGTVVKKEDAGGESPPIVDARSSSSAPTLQVGGESPIDVRLAQAGLSIKLYIHQVPDLHAFITGVEAIRTWL